MILLKATTEALELLTSSAADIDYSVSYADITTTTFNPSTSEGKIVTATTTVIAAAPGASTQRQIKLITLTNRHVSASNNVTVKKDISGTEYFLTPTITLLAGEVMQYMDGQGWMYYSTTGAIKGDQTASGSATEIQVNSNGILSGDPDFTYNGVSNELTLGGLDASMLFQNITTDPTTPGLNQMRLYAKQVSGRALPRFTGPSGLDSFVQPFLARNKVGYWNPPGNANTVPGVMGYTGSTATGTATGRNIATTNFFTRMRRLGYVSTATAASFTGARVPVAQITLGDGAGLGGFFKVIRFGTSDAATVSGARMFVGISSTTGAPANVEPSTLLNSIGVGHGAANTNLFIYYGGSVAQTPIDLGANFPANTLSVDAYELSLFSPPGVAATVYYEVTRLNTGHNAKGTLTGASGVVVPASTTLLTYLQAWRTNNATALAVGLDIMSDYIETDN